MTKRAGSSLMENSQRAPGEPRLGIQQPEIKSEMKSETRETATTSGSDAAPVGTQNFESTSSQKPTASSSQRPLNRLQIKAIAEAYRAAEREKRATKTAMDSAEAGGAATKFNHLVANLDDPQVLSSLQPSKKSRSHARGPKNNAQMAPPRKSYGLRPQKDPKVPPSAASGGVPTPTAAYISAAQPIATPLKEPQHIMIVIDLNGTLLYRPSRTQPTKFVERPNARRFIQYCVETFTVVIWSSAREANVNNMCKAFLSDELKGKVTAVWGRNKLGLSPEDYNLRVQVYKRLTKLWNDPHIMRSHPDYDFGGRWDQTNTVLIDDSLEKAKSEPFNIVEVPEYFGDVNEPYQILPQVHDYINWLSGHSNISSCIRNSPFKAMTQPPVAPRRP